MSQTWRTGILPNLSQSDRQQVENLQQPEKVARNQAIFSEGQVPKGVFLIVSGKVKIFATGDEGKQQIIHIAKTGELIGFRAMFSEEQYRVSAIALEDGAIGFIGKPEFTQFLDGNKAVRNAVIRELAKELGERAMYVTLLAQKTVRERLAIALMRLSEVYADEPINLTREDLANYVGTATETLIRLLKDFRKEGLIEVQTRKLRILDAGGLVRIAG